MKIWPAHVPHGTKTHATLAEPINVGEPSVHEPRTRRSLCGLAVYRGGPALEWDFVRILDRCGVCERAAKRWAGGA